MCVCVCVVCVCVCPLDTKAIVTFLCYFELFWDPRISVFETVKRSKYVPKNLKIDQFRVPFLDQILNVSQAINGVSRVQKELKIAQKCNNCFGI